MSRVRQLSLSRKYWSKYRSDGGILTVRLKVPNGADPVQAAGAYHRESYAPGGYFSTVISVRRAKRREFIVQARFGWDC